MKGTKRMKYIDGVKLLKENKLSPIILISGEEEYLKKDLLERIKKVYVEDNFADLNLDILDGANLEFKDLYEICETLPFMSENRFVIVENLSLDRNSISKISDLLDPLSEYLNRFPSSTYLLLLSSGKAYKGKFLKSFAKKFDHFEVEKLNQRELSNFISKKLSRNTIKIDSEGIRYLVENSMYLESEMKVTLFDVENELEKLINLNKSELTLEDIDKVLISSVESNIFRLTDAVGEKNNIKALHIYFRLLKSDSDPFHVFYMIIRQLRNLLYIKWAEIQKLSIAESKKNIGISDYEYKKVSKYCKNWEVESLIAGLHFAYDTEVKLKSSMTKKEDLFRNFIIKVLNQ